jgi:hypothetical protein
MLINLQIMTPINTTKRGPVVLTPAANSERVEKTMMVVPLSVEIVAQLRRRTRGAKSPSRRAADKNRRAFGRSITCRLTAWNDTGGVIGRLSATKPAELFSTFPLDE